MTIQTSVIKKDKHKDVSISGEGVLWGVGDLGLLNTYIFAKVFPLFIPAMTMIQYHIAKNNNLTICCNFRYDPKTDTWTTVSSLSVPRDAVGVCLLGDRLYAVGGYDGQSYLNTVESYDAQNNEWTEVIT